ncbi:type II toxin-antitoxin system VapC family toxin [Kyrpidia spormannii]|uniref:PilT protein domain protein n=2 Tax=Kyrpidia spormannii TaxID=2055160 RepID=A0ACA8Z549_9BACL|nr:type II toxin-antitoxin system VapC family toxin [Kyrpidia spormannii]CAB3389599.1 PilT protein domain protein [Kyrpidia spormannii]CAB3390487.1 PilT protein domain protein [Kyrpidia spormannii]
MKTLLDTHVFLWWITDDGRMSKRARAIIQDTRNELYLSAASAWEIAIKAALGRIRVYEDLDRFMTQQMNENGIVDLPVEILHALGVYGLPDLHRDPFDRLLVAQAIQEGMPIITADEWIKRYDVETIW